MLTAKTLCFVRVTKPLKREQMDDLQQAIPIALHIEAFISKAMSRLPVSHRKQAFSWMSRELLRQENACFR